MARHWEAEDVLKMASGFQPACVLMAGAELGVFDALAETPLTADGLAAALSTDPRATRMLADALAAMGLLIVDDGRYALAPGVSELLTEPRTEQGPPGVLAMVRHQANCLRKWTQLALVTQTGRPAERSVSIRGAACDTEAFIEAMNDISRPLAPRLIEALGPPAFEHLLDLGGGPGTWTIAFLAAVPEARATLFDLPDVIEIARRHVIIAKIADRVSLVAGDMTSDAPLPTGADLAWVSAIVHMNSRQQNRTLFEKVHAALAGGGRILIRDVIMAESRTLPVGGALFAVNMLLNTHAGGTYTLAELSDDLLAAGFVEPHLMLSGKFMDSVVAATKP